MSRFDLDTDFCLFRTIRGHRVFAPLIAILHPGRYSQRLTSD